MNVNTVGESVEWGVRNASGLMVCSQMEELEALRYANQANADVFRRDGHPYTAVRRTVNVSQWENFYGC